MTNGSPGASAAQQDAGHDGAGPGGASQHEGLQLVHLLRAITVELDLFGAEFASKHQLHPTDVRALIHLLDAARAGRQATPGWLGGQLGLNSASATALVDRLEDAGYVRRVRDTRDRRRVFLAVQEQAMTLGWSFFGPLISQMVTAMQAFDDAELSVVRRFLQDMLSIAAESRRQHGPAGQART
jgi:DNA-binding MarR family transcriptional regulator